jgi:4-amino-4-deoxy-L-arabinose transferase-like glycosyltransferase
MNAPDASVAPSSARTPVAHPLLWLLAMAAGHVLARVAVSPALKWDEAEQILWSQQLALGYGPQPPLYTWLQWAVNAVVGPSVLALALLKHGLLALTYALMWLAGRELLGPRGAWWASASMLLMPPLGWYSIRDQTHSILVTAMVCGAWWLLLRLVRQPKPATFAWLGLVCGLGMLAKYSFALVAAAMLVAALTVPQARRALLSRGWWWAPLVGLVVVLPHASWLFGHLQEATASTLSKMEIRPDRHLGHGLLSLLEGVAAMLLLWVLLAWWAFRGALWRRPLTPVAPWAQQVFLRYLGLTLLALLGMVLLGGVTNFKGRWMLPLLCMVPLAAFAARPELQAHPRGNRYTWAVTGVAVFFVIASGLRPWYSGHSGGPDELNHPAVELAQSLRDGGYDGRGLIVGSDHMLAGMLRTRFPQAPVDSCAWGAEQITRCVAANAERARREGRGLLLIWRSDRFEPGWWEAAQAPLAAGAPVRETELPFHMMRADAPPARYQWRWEPAAPAAAKATP